MPLLTTRAGASSKAFGFGASADSGPELTLIGTVTAANTSTSSYTFSFNGSLYKSILLSGSARTGTSSAGSLSVSLIYAGSDQSANGTMMGRTTSTYGNPTHNSSNLPGAIIAGTETNRTSFTMFIGSIDQDTRAKPVSMFIGYSSTQGAQYTSPGKIPVAGAVTGLKITGSQNFQIGSKFDLYGIKVA